MPLPFFNTAYSALKLSYLPSDYTAMWWRRVVRVKIKGELNA
jgi:hypothetical protein